MDMLDEKSRPRGFHDGSQVNTKTKREDVRFINVGGPVLEKSVKKERNTLKNLAGEAFFED